MCKINVKLLDHDITTPHAIMWIILFIFMTGMTMSNFHFGIVSNEKCRVHHGVIVKWKTGRQWYKVMHENTSLGLAIRVIYLFLYITSNVWLHRNKQMSTLDSFVWYSWCWRVINKEWLHKTSFCTVWQKQKDSQSRDLYNCTYVSGSFLNINGHCSIVESPRNAIKIFDIV